MSACSSAMARTRAAQSQIVAQVVDAEHDVRFRRYMVNVMVGDGHDAPGAPIVEEINPTHGNLMGRIEHISRMGALLTDFLLIRPGALHRANGGYLLLDARKLLTSPFAYEALKRALKSREIRIEAPAESMGLVSTQSLQPDPIPLNVKVILFGDRQLYYMLMQADPDFSRVFKVQADFDETIDRNDRNFVDYARMISSIVAMHGVRHVDASGVGRLIEQASRIADDSEKMSIEIGRDRRHRARSGFLGRRGRPQHHHPRRRQPGGRRADPARRPRARQDAGRFRTRDHAARRGRRPKSGRSTG